MRAPSSPQERSESHLMICPPRDGRRKCLLTAMRLFRRSRSMPRIARSLPALLIVLCLSSCKGITDALSTASGKTTYPSIWINASWLGGRTGTPLQSMGVTPNNIIARDTHAIPSFFCFVVKIIRQIIGNSTICHSTVGWNAVHSHFNHLDGRGFQRSPGWRRFKK